MTRLQTTIRTLSLSEGQRQTRAGNWRAIEPTAASPQAVAKGNLYALIELGGGQTPSPRLYRLLLNTIQGVYYDSAGGITGGLAEAVMAAHQVLQEHNALNPEAAQLAGLSCVALRGEELHLGVGGPAMILVGSADAIQQFPEKIDHSVVPLGGEDAPTLELFRTSINRQSLSIQLQSEWVARVDNRKLIAAAAAEDIEAADAYLQNLAPAKGAFSALLLQIQASEPAAASPHAAPVDEPDQPGETLPDRPPEANAAPAASIVGEAEQPETASTRAGEPAQLLVPVESTPDKPKRRWPWLLLLLIPLVIATAAAGAWWWQQRTMQLEFASLMQGAEAAFTAASAEGVPEAAARSQLREARERVDAALNIVPDNSAALAMQEEILLKQDVLDKVTPLYKLITLQPVGGADSDPTRVVVQGSRVYLLDKGLDRVVRYGLSEISGLILQPGEDVVAQRGQQLPDGQLVGELLDIAWVQAGGLRSTSNLLILDSNRNLLEVDDALGIDPLPVAGRDQWQSPLIAAGFNGNFYLLDSGLGQILRYRSSEDGYNNPPENYFANDASLDLSGAVDMAIDGSIWVLYQDGTVQVFFQGVQQPFQLEQPPNGPITQPQAIFAGSDAGLAQNIYIAESGQGRIIEYDKTGKYLRQFRPADPLDQEKLRQLRAFQVDEIERSFFILTAEGLYSTGIPN